MDLDAWTRFGLEFGPIGDQDEDELEAAWRLHGEGIVAAWVVADPGRRPWGWWTFDAREDRRELNPPRSRPHLAGERRRRPGNVWYGAMHARGGDDAATGSVPWLEHEHEYLERLGLWLPAERDRFVLFYGPPDGWRTPDLAALWRATGTATLAACVRARPGTRPWAWWRFEGPPPPAPETFERRRDGLTAPAEDVAAERETLRMHGLLTREEQPAAPASDRDQA